MMPDRPQHNPLDSTDCTSPVHRLGRDALQGMVRVVQDEPSVHTCPIGTVYYAVEWTLQCLREREV